ncbi:phenylacetate-CoA oxygenase, PaaJ subunit [Halovenus aranensis]|jgi:metal-sulfur cluster biosynthetic enzyme|uniref:Phenylacetate-CoA oxygenase, PaaJ subunit n=1 Tax=Halovenus aranensis TaxID=890420 RepID=A0A1G8YFF1_9EURY|nr:1,2-phenylacetyl-CoA epoxidase subunit PaaD [Halovenus aranensis]SDK01387.1 phenylacetate-CoA oxygenase, PaaJ subunit [Halovenus aranensis]
MSSDYDRPRADPDATACSYTDYDTKERAVGDVPATGDDAEGLEREVWSQLYTVEDPEMPVSIVDLGLIYGLELEDGTATIDMTLTYSGCPARELILDDVEAAAESVDGVDDAEVQLVWSPDWSVDLVTEQGKESLREFGMSIE